ncbi:hypothetical protein CDSM653_00653 [Caldanaerobacter subterraneus subsp. pacificus DSM 12653]|uniref:Uncharacterized protein n=1 Tax=Caldanaerobacter subterraneus subsp. pacificus DSM 12653 TaxID=391606 RepID=A0A0F5PPI1_9THEO|nr:hypothetical protein CDSM653_00653 [Caldanaerobacter subterraneus subsp. pacificus DSM 12653]
MLQNFWWTGMRNILTLSLLIDDPLKEVLTIESYVYIM